jgi:DNA-binding GntR family transcriptional regulator
VNKIVDNPVADPYQWLRDEIVAGRLQPNERLVETDLGERLGVGRGPIRTALLRLESEGLVERERNRGAKVRLVSEREAVEILETRAVLEGVAARYAAMKATPADARELREILAVMRQRLDSGDLLGASEQNVVLHRRVLELADHGTVRRLISALNSQIVRFQYRTILAPGRSEASFAEHTAIVDAIVAGDAVTAETEMRRHLSNVVEALSALS